MYKILGLGSGLHWQRGKEQSTYMPWFFRDKEKEKERGDIGAYKDIGVIGKLIVIVNS